MKKIIITEFMDKEAIDLLARNFDVHYDPQLYEMHDRIEELLKDASGIIVRNKTLVTSDLLSNAPVLEVVGRLGVGLDNIDLDACRVRNVAVYPAYGANARSVAEYIIGTALVLQRNILSASSDTNKGLWNRNSYLNGHESRGRIFGILGFGSIGRVVAELAKALGWTVVASRKRDIPENKCRDDDEINFVLKEKLFSISDIISIHLPLTEETRNMVGENELSSMKKGSILINTSRGNIVDEKALAALIKNKHLGGAVVDVFQKEPLKESPLFNLPNTILTPHIAGITEESNVRVSTVIAGKVSQLLLGKQN